MKDNKHIKKFNEHQENPNISDIIKQKRINGEELTDEEHNWLHSYLYNTDEEFRNMWNEKLEEYTSKQ